MAKLAGLFSGQGSQYPGMGKELYENFAGVRQLYACASDIMGFDVAKRSFAGTEEEMARTGVSQPLIFAHSMAALVAAGEVMDRLSAVAGHSLGEFAALCCAESYGVEDGFRLIKARAEAMEECARESGGAMYAIVGSNEEAVAAACREAGEDVWPVNFNLPGQTVISGGEEAAANAAEILAAAGAKAVKLAVSGAFHTAKMAPAAAKLKEAAGTLSFAPAKLEFYSNLTGGKHVVEDYPEYFAAHMVSPVRFVEQCNAMAAGGVELCVEFGPKKTVGTLAKKNVRALRVCNIEDLKTLEKAVVALG